MYKFSILNSATASFFEKLTYPIFRSDLRLLDYDNSLIAIGVTFNSQPIGLTIAKIADVKNAEILSLFIVPEQRKQGLGKLLLIYLEEELINYGCSMVSITYISNKTRFVIEKILKQQNWSVPQPNMLICSALIDDFKNVTWLKLSNNSSKYSIFYWIELTQQARESIQKKQNVSPWYPEILSPFKEEKIIEPLNSLGLRLQNTIVGWIITHRINSETIRYSSLFVRKDLQSSGRAIPLLATAIKLQLEKSLARKAVFTVVTDNSAMIKFVDKRLSPYLASIRQSWKSYKML